MVQFHEERRHRRWHAAGGGVRRRTVQHRPKLALPAQRLARRFRNRDSRLEQPTRICLIQTRRSGTLRAPRCLCTRRLAFGAGRSVRPALPRRERRQVVRRPKHRRVCHALQPLACLPRHNRARGNTASRTIARQCRARCRCSPDCSRPRAGLSSPATSAAMRWRWTPRPASCWGSSRAEGGSLMGLADTTSGRQAGLALVFPGRQADPGSVTRSRRADHCGSSASTARRRTRRNTTPRSMRRCCRTTRRTERPSRPSRCNEAAKSPAALIRHASVLTAV